MRANGNSMPLSKGGLRHMAIAALMGGIFATPAAAEGPFTGLSGTWRGAAQVRLQSGSSETLKCYAYYTPKGTGVELGLAIRCASASNKIELRAQLTAAGNKVSGRWEERTYNAMGDVSGSAQEGRLSLIIDGGAFKGSMAVKTIGTSQTVLIKTEGIALLGVNINLSRG
ncbi:MAG: hypothetical protein R3D44_14645 [Hyphomicrobiaceae bacterium]